MGKILLEPLEKWAVTVTLYGKGGLNLVGHPAEQGPLIEMNGKCFFKAKMLSRYQ